MAAVDAAVARHLMAERTDARCVYVCVCVCVCVLVGGWVGGFDGCRVGYAGRRVGVRAMDVVVVEVCGQTGNTAGVCASAMFITWGCGDVEER